MNASGVRAFVVGALVIGAIAGGTGRALAQNPGGYLFITTLDIQYQSSGSVLFSGQYQNECKKLPKGAILVFKWDNVPIPGASFTIGGGSGEQMFSVSGVFPIVRPPKNNTTELGFMITTPDDARVGLIDPGKSSPCAATLSVGSPG
jgi:hypothetical protein